MIVKKIAKAGSLESNDILIILGPNEEPGIVIEIQSIVLKQFGVQIEKVIRETLKELNVSSAVMKVEDRGALDYTIRARVETAVKRAVEEAD